MFQFCSPLEKNQNLKVVAKSTFINLVTACWMLGCIAVGDYHLLSFHDEFYKGKSVFVPCQSKGTVDESNSVLICGVVNGDYAGFTNSSLQYSLAK